MTQTEEKRTHEGDAQRPISEGEYTRFIVDSLAKGTQPIYARENAGQFAPLLDILREDYNPDALDEFTFALEALKNKHQPFKTLLEKNNKGPREGYPKPSDVAVERVCECYQENELGDAFLFAEAFNGRVCYDHTAKKWYLWTGHSWKKDTTGRIRLLISGELGSIYLKAAAELNIKGADLQLRMTPLLDNMIENQNELGPLQDQYKQMQAEMKQFSARAKDLRGSKRMSNVSNFIQSLMGVVSSQWDRDPWLIGTADGVIDLRTGAFRDGNPEDHIRTTIPTEWTGLTTQCPRFERFLQEIFADNKDKDAIIKFLQRLLGYGITGMTNYAIFPIAYGEDGRNGKDTLFGILKDILGGLVGAVSNDVFVSNDKFKSGGAATPHICDLQGKRLVWGSETKQGDKLNIAQLKHLTGGGEVTARQNYGEQYTFDPTHKLFLMTNYKPHADANDKAFWSRACLIEFGIRFVSDPKAPNERKADTQLKETLKQEASGILAWLVRGCLAWQREGLDIPQSIQLATKKYRDEEDNALQFVEDRCVKEPGAKAKATPLYNAYKTWSKDQGFYTMNNKQFSAAMEKLEGVEKGRGNRGIEYTGVRLIPADEDLFAGNGYTGKESA